MKMRVKGPGHLIQDRLGIIGGRGVSEVLRKRRNPCSGCAL